MPAEWKTAVKTLVAMNNVAGPIGPARKKSLLAFTCAFVAGVAPAIVVMPELVAVPDKEVSLAVMAAVLAFAGLLVGFIAALMLFTGKLEGANSLTLEEAQAFSSRLKYLLASQAMTLFAALLLATLSIIWMVLVAISANATSCSVIGIVLSGFAAVSLFRMFLLPMQIYELHEAWLALQVQEKVRQLQEFYSTDRTS